MQSYRGRVLRGFFFQEFGGLSCFLILGSYGYRLCITFALETLFGGGKEAPHFLTPLLGLKGQIFLTCPSTKPGSACCCFCHKFAVSCNHSKGGNPGVWFLKSCGFHSSSPLALARCKLAYFRRDLQVRKSQPWLGPRRAEFLQGSRTEPLSADAVGLQCRYSAGRPLALFASGAFLLKTGQCFISSNL